MSVSTLRRSGASTAQRTYKTYQPVGNAQKVLRWTDTEILFCGPVRTGKTRSILEKIHFLCMQYPGCRVLLLRQTRRSLAQSVLLTFERDVLPEGCVKKGKGSRENRYSYQYQNGSEIVLGGLDDPDKFLSSEYDIIYIAQAEECIEDALATLKTRLSNYVLPFQQLLMDANPKSPSHWLWQRCLNRLCTYVEARWQDNPKYCTGSGELPPYEPRISEYWDGVQWTEIGLEFMKAAGWTKEGIDYIATQWNTPGYMFERLILGKWAQPEGARFKGADRNSEQGFDFEKQFPHGIPAGWPRWTSGDYGKADPYCHLWHTRATDGTKYTYICDYELGYEADQQAERVVDRSGSDGPYEGHYMDPSMWSRLESFGAKNVSGRLIPAGDLYASVFAAANKKAGYSQFGPLVRGAHNHKEEGYVTLDQELRSGKWKIARRCVDLWNELESAVHYKDPRTGIWSEEINPGDKKYCPDHALEAAVRGLHKRAPAPPKRDGDTIDVAASRNLEAKKRADESYRRLREDNRRKAKGRRSYR